MRHNSKAYTLLTPPASEPVALADVKTFLRIDGTANDAVLAILISSARRMAEEYTKRSLITQSWTLVMDRFVDADPLLPEGQHVAPTPYLVNGSLEIPLSRGPIQSITSIETFDLTNSASTVSTDVYELDIENSRLLLNEGYSWPTELRDRAAVKITFDSGYGAAAAVPESIRSGILQHVAASYTNKVCADIPAGVRALYDPYRLVDAFGGF